MNNIKENMENKLEQDKATILGLLSRRPRGTYTDDVAELTGLRFDRVRILLHGLKEEGKVTAKEIAYEFLPVAIQGKVSTGMRRNLWKVAE